MEIRRRADERRQMVLIADRPGDRCWGKLDGFAEDQAEEKIVSG